MVAKKTPAKPGRKAPEGEKKQFLTTMDPEIIRRIKAAAAMEDVTASAILEKAAKEWLDRSPGRDKTRRGDG